MIEPKTLEKVRKVQEHLTIARRTMEDIIDIEGNDWAPGLGPKPDRMRMAEQWRYDLVDMTDRIEVTYS